MLFTTETIENNELNIINDFFSEINNEFAPVNTVDENQAVSRAEVHAEVRGKQPPQIVNNHLVHQLNDSHLGIIALAYTGTINAGETAGAILITSRQHIKQFFVGVLIFQGIFNGQMIIGFG